MLILSVTPQEPDGTYLDTCIAQMAVKDEAGLEGLYRETGASVYAYALSILKNTFDAEDVMHDCYLQAYHSAAGYRSSGKPMAWILTITRNLCFQKLREKSRTTDLPEETWELQPGENSCLSVDEKMLIETSMQVLSDEERQILVLHAVAGFRHREIAGLMNLRLPTVLSKYARAVKKLKLALEKEEHTP